MKILFALSISALASTQLIAVSKTAFDSGAIHPFGDNGGTDYYGSGNDDIFVEYGIASFQYSSTDFGVPSITSITSMDYTLTVNDRSFSDGNTVRFYLTTDTFDADYSGLFYDDSGSSDPDGVFTAGYTTLIDLGVYAVSQDLATSAGNGGNLEIFNLNFGLAETELIGAINSNSAFSIIIAAVNVNDDITFSGVGNTFDPGDPLLNITAVPEPETYGMLLGVVTILFALYRRQTKAAKV